ncbi:MAG: choice-of-anchor J domain-containing protein, partial [Verrucomicrobiia bacterium]
MKMLNRVTVLAFVVSALFSAATGVLAQTVIWSENFDDGNGNNRWYADNGVWQIGTPSIGPATNSAGYRTHSGPYCATTGLSNDYPVSTDSRLIRIASFTVPAANQSPRLRFYEWYSFTSCYGNDYGVVEVKVVGSNTWQEVSPRRYNNSGDWTDTSVDLSAYAGQTVQVAFQMVWNHPTGYSCSGPNAPGWYIDDIAFESGTPVFNNPEGFENGIGDWYAETGVWQVGVPTSGPGSAHSGTNCAATILNGNYPWSANSRFISPPVTIPAASQSPRLRFYEWYSFTSCYGSDYGVVEVKVVGSNTWQTVSPNRYNSSGGWTDTSVDLSAYAGQTVQVAFHMVFAQPGGYSCSGTSPGWYIDDIALVTGTPVFNNPEGFENGIGDWYAETGVWQVGVPTSGPGSAHSGTNCAATILNGNYPWSANS